MKSLPLILLIILAGFSPPLSAADEGYAQDLSAALATIREAQQLSGVERAAAVDRAVEALQNVGPVEVGDEVVMPYLGHVQDALREAPPDVEEADRLLQALLSALEGQVAQPATASQEEALRATLADPRFAPTPPEGWWSRTVRAVRRWIGRLFSRVGLPETAGGLDLARVLLVVASVAFVGVTLVVLLRAVQAQRARSREPENLSNREQPLNSASMLAAAADHARNGEYRLAVRANFVSLLLYLHERGSLRYERSLTNREHLGRIGAGTPLAAALGPVVTVFDDVWYGNEPVGAREYDSYQQQTDALRAGVG